MDMLIDYCCSYNILLSLNLIESCIRIEVPVPQTIRMYSYLDRVLAQCHESFILKQRFYPIARG